MTKANDGARLPGLMPNRLPERAPAPWGGAFSREFEPVPKLVVLGGDPTALAIAFWRSSQPRRCCADP